MGALNEILPKATGVGKVDPNSNGTGEVFNSYEDYIANKATGEYSHAEGAYTTATGDSSHAEGNGSTALGTYSHAEGYGTRALNLYEHAEGSCNVSNTGDTEDLQTRHSVGIGSSNSDRKNAHEIMANGDHYIYGLGNFDGTNSADAQTLQEVINSKQTITDAVGKIDSTSDGTGEIFNSYEGGNANVASGRYSHAEGDHTTAIGLRSHAECYYTTATGEHSHAEGDHTTASGLRSHAEGAFSSAGGNYSHAEGYYTTATTNRSHAEGDHTTAIGLGAHAEGTYTKTLSESEHAEGRYNKSYSSEDASVRVIHSVGIGSTIDDRKNAHEIKFNGDHYVYGVGGYDGTNSTDARTLQEVINTMFNITVDLRGYDTVMANNGAGFIIADLSDRHYINGADIFIKDDDIEGEIKYFVVEKNENMTKTINFDNGNTFEYTQEYGLKRNGDELVKVYARYGKYSTEEESKWWLMKVIPASGGVN